MVNDANQNKLSQLLAKDEKIFLEAIYEYQRKGETVSDRKIIVELSKRLGRHFVPPEIPGTFLRDNKVTILGVTLLDPNCDLVTSTNRVISGVQKILNDHPDIQSITSKNIVETTGLDLHIVEAALRELEEFGGIFHQSGLMGVDNGRSAMNLDGTSFHDYMKYESLQQVLEDRASRMYVANYEIVPESKNMDFSFVFDNKLAMIIDRDYRELQGLDPQKDTKSVIVLAGGIMEGLLFDALVASGKWTFQQACGNYLKDMIGPAMSKGIITEDRLASVVRKYRNLIHPGHEIKEEMIFDASDASLSKTAVEIFIREVAAWSIKEKKRKALNSYLDGISDIQKSFLLLFGIPRNEAEKFEHPWLENDVLGSLDNLVRNGIMTREKFKLSERVTLISEATPRVEEVILNGPIKRESILLNYGNIASGLGAGSGATGSSRRK